MYFRSRFSKRIVLSAIALLVLAAFLSAGYHTEPRVYARSSKMGPGAVANVAIKPPTINTPVGTVFTVDLNISDVADLFAYEIKIWYLNAVINATNVARPSGHFLEPQFDPSNYFVPRWEIKNNYNATHGRIWLAFTLLAPENGRTGVGILARLTFKGLATGSSPIVLNNYPGANGPVILSSSYALPIQHTAADGMAIIGSFPSATLIRFSLTPNPAIAGQTVILLGNLTTVSNLPIPNAGLTLKSNGTPVASLTTNSSGWVKASGQVPSAGTFNITIVYAGSQQYLPSSASQIMIVNKAQTEIYAKFTPNPVNQTQSTTLKGILLDQSYNRIKLATITLQYSMNYGQTWNLVGTTTTDSNGIFRATIIGSSPGIYLWRTTYAGSPTLLPCSADTPLIVR